MQARAHRVEVRAVMVATALALASAAVTLSACSDDESTTPTGSTNYLGLMASTAGQTGPLQITFASPVSVRGATTAAFAVDPVSATGTFALGGSGAVPISGTLTDGALTMSGGGWTLTGTLSDGKITGTFTGPGGVNGSLAAASSTEGSPARAYCGSYSGIDHSDDSEDLGTFSFVVAGNILLGTAVSDGGNAEDFSGTATSNTITVHKSLDGGFLNVAGTYDATSTSGTYNTKTIADVIVSEGTFTGQLCD